MATARNRTAKPTLIAAIWLAIEGAIGLNGYGAELSEASELGIEL